MTYTCSYQGSSIAHLKATTISLHVALPCATSHSYRRCVSSSNVTLITIPKQWILPRHSMCFRHLVFASSILVVTSTWGQVYWRSYGFHHHKLQDTLVKDIITLSLGNISSSSHRVLYLACGRLVAPARFLFRNALAIALS